jgi:hypothetical protein
MSPKIQQKNTQKKNLNDPHIIRTILGVNAKSSDISDMVLNSTATHALQGVPLQWIGPKLSCFPDAGLEAELELGARIRCANGFKKHACRII